MTLIKHPLCIKSAVVDWFSVKGSQLQMFDLFSHMRSYPLSFEISIYKETKIGLSQEFSEKKAEIQLSKSEKQGTGQGQI